MGRRDDNDSEVDDTISQKDVPVSANEESNLDELEKEKMSGADKLDATEDEDSDIYTDTDDTDSENNDYEGEAENRRVQYMFDMTKLEKQFRDLKEQFFKERITEIEEQLKDLNQSKDQEYTGPLKQLETECLNHVDVAMHLKQYREMNLDNSFKCEFQAAEQHYQNQQMFLMEELMQDLEEKLRKVEEDRYGIDMYSDLSIDSNDGKKKRKGMHGLVPAKRKKPIAITGPCIVYMLHEMDILEDWAAIRKAKCKLARTKTAEMCSL